MSKISFVVPVHNEKATLEKLYERIQEVCKENNYEHEIVFVDDGSDDGSFDVLKKLAEKDKHVIVLQFQRNFGQTAALSAGIQHTKAPYIVTLDADLQNDPGDVPALLKKLEDGYDVVSGWRKKRKDMLIRKIPSVLANALISRITGVRLSDYGCTLKVYKREYIENSPLYGDMHRFIPVFAAWYGARVTEIPVSHHSRKHGRSHYGLVNRTARVLLDMVTVKFLHSYLTRPMHFFGSIGAWLIFFGGFAGIAAIVLKVMDVRAFVDTPLPLLAVFLVTIGIVSMLLGLLAELLIRVYFEQPGHKSYRIHTVINSKEES